MAIEEIQRDTKKAAARADVVGASGWKPCPILKTNKRFLSNTLRTVINHNRKTTQKHRQESTRKMSDLNKRPPKFGTRLHSYQLENERMSKTIEKKSEK